MLLWANNGDIISKQYAGTNALKVRESIHFASTKTFLGAENYDFNIKCDNEVNWLYWTETIYLIQLFLNLSVAKWSLTKLTN